jgi:hypothetical protein
MTPEYDAYMQQAFRYHMRKLGFDIQPCPTHGAEFLLTCEECVATAMPFREEVLKLQEEMDAARRIEANSNPCREW